MGRLKLLLIAILTLNPLFFVNGQTSTFDQITQEQTRLEMNSTILLSGQDLLYRVVVQGAQKNLSKIAYVSLIDERGKTWFLHKVAINKQRIGSASFIIPPDAITGNYKLLSYTSWSKNNKKTAYFSQDLLVINPFIPLKKGVNAPSTKEIYTIIERESSKDVTTGNSAINVALNTQTYRPREEVIVDITAENLAFEGNYGLSVRQVPVTQTDQKLQASHINHKEENKMYLPEIKGDLISGNIESDETSVSNQLISLSIPGKKSNFKLTETNKDGRFVFLIDQPYDTSKAIIQVLDKSVDFKIIVDVNLPEPAEKPSFKKVILDPSLTYWITEQSIDLQIENAYQELPTTATDSIENQKFYHPFATRYILDDYTRFPSMHETFTEVVELAAMRIETDQVRMLVYNSDAIFKSELNKLAPLILIDGIQIQDFSLVANLKPARVDNIDVVAQQYRYGPRIFGGIIAINTKENDFRLPENSPNMTSFELVNPIKNSGFINKNYQNKSDFSRIPDYRSQLFWNPQIAITQQPKQISFFTSDKKGIFEIALTGYTLSGEKIEVKKTFRVLMEQ